jgi:hypothetical protein
MNRLARFLILLAGAMAIVPSLPLYLKRTMLRSWLVGGRVGHLIEYNWKICTLYDYWSNYLYFRREQERPVLWLALTLALALTYALLIALGVDQILVRWKRHRERLR